MKVWLDDVRAPYVFGRIGWRWAQTAEEAIELLERGDVKAISLDHDLAPEHYAGEHAKEIKGAKTGMDVVKWMCSHRVFPPKIYLHSMNPVGRANMAAAFDALGVPYEVQIARPV
jgi:hypothetical protein